MDSPLFMLLVAGGLFSLFWLGFARLVSSKDEWKKEKSNNLEMVGLMIVVIVVVGAFVAVGEM